jgi:hypothetical protein
VGVAIHRELEPSSRTDAPTATDLDVHAVADRVFDLLTARIEDERMRRGL